MMKFNGKEPLETISVTVKEKLEALTAKIPELKNMEVGLNVKTKPSAHDLVLIADFDNEEGLNAYRVHPEHVKILEIMKETVEKTAVVDYYY